MLKTVSSRLHQARLTSLMPRSLLGVGRRHGAKVGSLDTLASSFSILSKNDDMLELAVAGDGFSVGCLNHAGKVDPWCAAKQGEIGHRESFLWAFRDIVQTSKTVNFFIRGQSLEFYPDMFSIASVSSPWVMKTRVHHIGNTSVWVAHTTRCEKTGVKLFRGMFQLVRVDLVKRRTVSFQDDSLAKYREVINADSAPDLQLNFPDDLPGPDRLFRTSLKALSSDTDQSHHVNQAVFIRYCTDSASLAAVQGGVFKAFKKDLGYYNAKTFKLEYAGELLPGNDVEVVCWEDETRPHVLYFLVKKGERVCCRCVGEWHTNQDGSLTELTKSALPDDVRAKL